MPTDRNLSCSAAFEMLRGLLLQYAEIMSSADVEIFAIEMEMIPGSSDSADPALWDEFSKACAEPLSVRQAISLVAEFVEKELVVLRHVDSAKRIVEDLRAALKSPEDAPEPIQTLLRK